MSDNGHPRGRRVPALPEFTTSAGYTVQIRRISPDTGPRMRAAAERELASTKPAAPTQRVPIAPDGRGGTIEADIAVPTDPAHAEALAAWGREVSRLAARKLVQLLAEYVVVSAIDAEQVAALRAAYAALGEALDGESDRDIWLWRIVAPSPEDQRGLMAFAIGQSTPSAEAIQAQKATFRSDA